MAQSTIAKLFVELGFRDQEFQTGIRRATNGLEQLSTAGDKFSNIFGGTINRAFQAATLAATGFAAATTVVGAKFEQEITTVGAIAGSTRQEIEQLTATALNLGATTTYSATEAAEAMQNLARAGMDTNEIMAASEPAMLLAGAAGTDMALATSTMSAALAQFSLDATESTRVSDVFGSVLRNSLFDLSSLAEAMKYAGSVGAGFGMTLEETVAAVAQFRNLGLEGSMAGTQFRMAMSSAANVTERARETLHKYGLTQEMINPATSNFADILRRVGEAGMDAPDAISVFGERSGANIALLARQFAEGESNYDDLVLTLQTSAGTTKELYQTMTETVLGQFTILGSAVQDLMLKLFETYRVPLQDLLRTIGEVVNFVADEFQRRSSEVTGNLTSAIRNIETYVSANRQMFADTFIAIVNLVTRVFQVLTRFTPILDEILIGMTAIFAIGRIAAFIGALGQAGIALNAVRLAVINLTAQISASTGGIYLAVVAIGTLITALVMLATQFSSAERKANELAEAQANLDKRMKKEAEDYQRGVHAMTSATNDFARTREEQLRLTGELTETYEKELQALQRMDQEQLAAAETAGTVVRVQENGKDVFKTVAMLHEEASNAALGEANAYDLVRKRQQALTDEVDGYVYSQQEAKLVLDLYNRNVEAYGEALARNILISKGFKNEAELRKYLEEVTKKGEYAIGNLEKLTAAMASVEHQARKAEILNVLADAEAEAARRAREAAEAQERYAEALEKAMEARIKAQESAQEFLESALVTEEQTLKVAMDKQLAALTQAFSEEINLRRGNAAAVEELTMLHNMAVEQITLGHRVIAERQTQQAHDQEIASLENLVFSKEQLRNRDREEQEKALELQFQKELNLYESESEEILTVLTRFHRARMVMNNRFREEDAQRLKEYQDKIDQITESGEYSRVDRIREIQREAAQNSVKFEDASQKQREQLQNYYAGRRIQEERQIRRDVAALIDKNAAEIISLEDELAEKLIEIPEYMGAERLKVIEYYQRKIAEVNEKGREEAEKVPDVEPVVEAVKKVADVYGVVKDAISAVGSTYQQVLGGLESLTGFAFNLVDAVSQVSSTMIDAAEQREELKRAFREGELTPREYNAQLRELPRTATEAAQEYVRVLMTGAYTTVRTFVEAAPILLEELTKTLPTLLTMVAGALPRIATGLVRTIPELVNAIVAELPNIARELGKAVPVLVRMIVNQLPVLIAAVNETSPIIIDGLARGLAILIRGLPQIVDSLLQGLPAIIDALIVGLQRVILALVDAIPDLINVVIQNLPGIVLALFNGVFKILKMLVTQIPNLIVGIIEQIPVLISALLGELLPGLITTALGAIPSIIGNLLNAIPKLVLAVILAIPQIILALVAALPMIVTALIEAIPKLIMEFVNGIIVKAPMIVVEFIKALAIGLVEAAKQFVKVVGDIFKQAFQAIGNLFKKKEDEQEQPENFADTPGPVFSKGKGLLAKFAPGDFVIAAKEPTNLIRQAMGIMGGTGLEPGAMEIPSIAGLAQAILQSSGFGEEPRQNQGQDQTAIQVTVTAEGRTLDEVLYLGSKRGGTPRLSSMMKRSTVTGAHVGFTRGRYSPSS